MITDLSDVKKVSIVDDDEGARDSWEYAIADAQMTPVVESGPLGKFDDYMLRPLMSDAVLCDYELRAANNYAQFTGAELVAGRYKRGVPGVLCTRYEKAQIEAIRPYRRWIPVMITPDELDPDSLARGLAESIRELTVDFRPSRRPWRTLVHFLDTDPGNTDTYFIDVPGWGIDEVLRVRVEDLPEPLRSVVVPGFRCHAKANLAAELSEDLYLTEWEPS